MQVYTTRHRGAFPTQKRFWFTGQACLQPTALTRADHTSPFIFHHLLHGTDHNPLAYEELFVFYIDNKCNLVLELTINI